MKITPVEWKEQYNVGEPLVDNAHRKLFSIMNRITALMAEDNHEKAVFAVQEAVKYLESYTLQHFAEEEAYQRKIGYPGYEMHKALHDNLRDVTLPSMVEDLEESDYSEESISCFVGMFAGWITGHIIIEDRAITGCVNSRHGEIANRDIINLIDSEMILFIRDFFGLEGRLHNKHYAGESIPPSLYYEMDYESTSGHKYIVNLISENDLVIHMASQITGIDYRKMEKAVIMSYVQLAQTLTKQTLAMIEADTAFLITGHKMISDEILKKRFEKKNPEYSLMWKTSIGYLGMCIQVL